MSSPAKAEGILAVSGVMRSGRGSRGVRCPPTSMCHRVPALAFGYPKLSPRNYPMTRKNPYVSYGGRFSLLRV